MCVHRPPHRLFLGLAVLLAATGTTAQEPEPAPKPGTAAARQPTDPQPVELETTDGVLLRGVFYPAEKTGKQTPVLVMLPDEGESPAVFDKLAMRLQFALGGEGHRPTSVLAIALRGQGDSTRVRRADGEYEDRRGAKPTAADADAMVKRDMEAVRKYLVQQNDSGRLNLNRLGYLGVGAGALVAANAAAVDWAVPIFNRGKQGRDVKALVLVSPPWKRPGLEMLPALRQPGVQREVAVLITYGAELAPARSDAQRILRQLAKGRPTPPAPAEGENPVSPTVVDLPGESKLQGTAWLRQAGPDGESQMLAFLDERLAKPDLPWVQRRLD